MQVSSCLAQPRHSPKKHSHRANFTESSSGLGNCTFSLSYSAIIIFGKIPSFPPPLCHSHPLQYTVTLRLVLSQSLSKHFTEHEGYWYHQVIMWWWCYVYSPTDCHTQAFTAQNAYKPTTSKSSTTGGLAGGILCLLI